MRKTLFCLFLNGASLFLSQPVFAAYEYAAVEKEKLECKDLTLHLLERFHPAWSILEGIFSQWDAFESDAGLARAGFKMVSSRSTGMRVVAHPQLPGYLLKLYPLNEKNNRQLDISWAIERCSNAKKLKDFVAQKQLKHFTVPMKWIYLLSNRKEMKTRGIKNYAVLLVEDMKLVSQKQSHLVWSHLSSTEVLDELYTILSYGYSSCHLPANMPFTQYGTFSCIDTEKPHKKPGYERVNKYLSPDMQRYWNRLVYKAEKVDRR